MNRIGCVMVGILTSSTVDRIWVPFVPNQRL